MKKYKIQFSFIILGAISFFIKGLSGEYLDSQGILHEYFFLIPIGYLFIFIGLIGIGFAFIKGRILNKN